MIRRVLLILALLAPAALRAEPAALGPGQALRGAFVQERHLNGFAKPLVSRGRFALYPGLGLIWRTDAPFAITVAATDSGMVQLTQGRETMRLSAAKMPFLARMNDIMAGALAGEWSKLDQAFQVRRDADQAVLTPRHAEMAAALSRITAQMDRFVERVEVLKPQGDRDVLTFSEQVIGDFAPEPEESRLFGLTK